MGMYDTIIRPPMKRMTKNLRVKKYGEKNMWQSCAYTPPKGGLGTTLVRSRAPDRVEKAGLFKVANHIEKG